MPLNSIYWGSAVPPAEHRRAALLLLVVVVAACNRAPLPAANLLPANCGDLDAAWGEADWPRVLNVLDDLEQQGLACGADPFDQKRYSAFVNYGAALEAAGLTLEAVEQYRAALAVNGRGREAVTALRRLNALPAPTPAPCQPDGELAPYQPASRTSPVTMDGRQFVVNGRLWGVSGVNYYPPKAPWERFLPEMNLAEVDEEWELIAAAGFNMVRIFLWYDPLFTCEPATATPNAAAFERLDGLIALASRHNLRLLLTLHDLPDLTFRPLYTDWARYDAQTAFIVSRYRNEPAILAWDLRNEGDLDYGASGYHTVAATRDEVLGWLAHASDVVRQQSPTQLVTAGWWGDTLETESSVDFLSFHHWGAAGDLRARLEGVWQNSDRPVMVEEFGYHSWPQAPGGGQDEARQAALLDEALAVMADDRVAGWAVWAAFDFAPPSTAAEGYEHHFGLWRSNLTPKPALETVQRHLAAQP